VAVSAAFEHGGKRVEVAGFYDGGGVYKVRFMPSEEGEWRYLTHSNRKDLDGKTGEFVCGKAGGVINHGPVGVKNTFHFGYADGTAYVPVGTTCYYWVFQSEALQEQTVATLKASPFNKVRMFVMPTADAEASVYPFEGTPPKGWDFTRFNPAFFQGIEKRVGELRDAGIEADVILFNVYDKGRWGYDAMGAANDDRYVRYVVARLGAYRNVGGRWPTSLTWGRRRRTRIGIGCFRWCRRAIRMGICGRFITACGCMTMASRG
jgi:hypothetical protein